MNEYKYIKKFIDQNYKHFNSYSLKAASEGYVKLIKQKGKMFLAMAGAMSTAEIGISLAEMIRKNKIHAITCTGANLEEDVFNLISQKNYKMVPDYRHLTPKEELEILNSELNRVTDVAIAEEDAFRKIGPLILEEWQKAEAKGKSYFPHQYLYNVLKSGKLKKFYQVSPKNSWMIAAMEKNLPIFVPGWEDSSLGNMFAASVIKGEIKNVHTVKGGQEYMIELVSWYEKTRPKNKIGFFQIGGGIAGDFPICVVPLLLFDLNRKVKLWSYFCQISDSTTSYGSYSGAVPNEKITWGKLAVDTPSYIIESDATIVVPLIFSFVLAS
ncbi:MAG TPA: deoxyhypusine synthase family protein [Patescibacteria group bacterium]